MNDNIQTANKTMGWAALALWGFLIVAGIVAKRYYHHPDWMVFFHLPAAVMLVMAFGILSRDVRKKYQEQLKSMRRRSVAPVPKPALVSLSQKSCCGCCSEKKEEASACGETC